VVDLRDAEGAIDDRVIDALLVDENCYSC